MSKPVIFIPGFPGTHLHDASTGKRLFLNIKLLLSGNASQLRRLKGPDDLAAGDDLVAGEPVGKLGRFLLFDLSKQADSLYAILRRINIDPVKFGYDWRRPVWDEPMQARLGEEIRALRERSGQRVVIIAHSTGCLVARHWLEHATSSAIDRVDRLIAFGAPWAGTLKPLEFLTGQKGIPLIKKAISQEIMASAWAAFDLLPPDPARTSMLDASGNALDLVVDGAGRQVSPNLKQDWFPSQHRNAMMLRANSANRELGARAASLNIAGNRILPVTNIVGFGAETTIQSTIKGSGDQQTVELSSGKGDHTLDGGDGTVPRVSAAWLRGPGIVTHHVPVGADHNVRTSPHSILWRNPGGINLLRDQLAGEELGAFAYAAIDEQDFVEGDNVRIRLVALDADGAPLPDSSVSTIDQLGSPIKTAFDLAHNGRHLLSVPRDRIRKVHNGRLRRLTIEIRWNGGAQKRSLVLQP